MTDTPSMTDSDIPEHLWGLLADDETTTDPDDVELPHTELGRGPMSGGYPVDEHTLVLLVYKHLYEHTEDMPCWYWCEGEDMEVRVPRDGGVYVQSEGYSAEIKIPAYVNGSISYVDHLVEEALAEREIDAEVSVGTERWTAVQVFELLLPHMPDGLPEDESDVPRPVVDLIRQVAGHPRDAAHLQKAEITVFLPASDPQYG